MLVSGVCHNNLNHRHLYPLRPTLRPFRTIPRAYSWAAAPCSMLEWDFLLSGLLGEYLCPKAKARKMGKQFSSAHFFFAPSQLRKERIKVHFALLFVRAVKKKLSSSRTQRRLITRNRSSGTNQRKKLMLRKQVYFSTYTPHRINEEDAAQSVFLVLLKDLASIRCFGTDQRELMCWKNKSILAVS